MIKEYIYTKIRKTEFEKPIDDNLLYRATSLKKLTQKTLKKFQVVLQRI